MHDFTWEDSVSGLREAHHGRVPIASSLLISEIEMLWKNANIGNYRVTPLRRTAMSIIGEQFVHLWPYSNLLVLARQDHEIKDMSLEYFEGVNIGPAISSILSFVMRCAVIAFNQPSFPLVGPKDSFRLSNDGKHWAESWGNILYRQDGLRRYLRGYHPTPQEEQDLIKTMTQVYEILMDLDETTYQSMMRVMRLYQLAFFTAREDSSLAYSLLVAAAEATSSGFKVKVRLRDIDPEGRLEKVMEELQFDDQLQNLIKRDIAHQETLTKRFSNFVSNNLPDTFWEGDYSMAAETDLFSEGYRSGQFDRDLSKWVPEPIREKLLREAEEKKEQYEEFKKQRLPSWVLNKEEREWWRNYYRVHLDRVLRNTYESRSKLFHVGRGFPKKALKEGFVDWIPELIDEDFWKFHEKHLDPEHRSSHHLDKEGRIFRTCSCGYEKETKMILNIWVFERMVHDSIFNYLLKLNKT